MNCYACGSDRTRPSRTVHGITIFGCDDCRLFWVPDIPIRQVNEYYADGYFNLKDSVSGYRDYLAEERLHRKNSRILLKAALRCFQSRGKRRVLDVGCAYGFLLDEARKMGLEGHGVELSEKAALYARDALHLDVRRGTLHAQGFPEAHFDMIFVVGTLEHLTDPLRELEEIARLLRPDGVLVITTINTEGLLPFFSWKPPEHLYYFSARNLAMLLEKSSLGILSVRTHWSYYRVTDLLYRMRQFFSARVPDPATKLLGRTKPWGCYLKIPTNEMRVIARRKT